MTKKGAGDGGGEWKRIVDGRGGVVEGKRRVGWKGEKGREGKRMGGMDGSKREFSQTRSLARSDVGWFVAAAAELVLLSQGNQSGLATARLDPSPFPSRFLVVADLNIYFVLFSLPPFTSASTGNTARRSSSFSPPACGIEYQYHTKKTPKRFQSISDLLLSSLLCHSQYGSHMVSPTSPSPRLTPLVLLYVSR